jgi:multidrug efflux pump subunit AcrA (membrane-fusion protein)
MTEAAAPPPIPPAGAEVGLAKPQRQTLTLTVEQPGRVEAFEQTPVYAKIAGYVKAVRVEIGSRVRQGDLLAELDVPEMVEELRQKEGLVTQARLEIRQAESALRVSEASLATAVSLAREAQAGRKKAEANAQRWKSECARMEGLVKDRVIDAQSRDETRNQCRAAEAALEEADARAMSAEAARAEAAAKRDKADADLAAARNRLALAESDERRMRANTCCGRRSPSAGSRPRPASSSTSSTCHPAITIRPRTKQCPPLRTAGTWPTATRPTTARSS